VVNQRECCCGGLSGACVCCRVSAMGHVSEMPGPCRDLPNVRLVEHKRCDQACWGHGLQSTTSALQSVVMSCQDNHRASGQDDARELRGYCAVMLLCGAFRRCVDRARYASLYQVLCVCVCVCVCVCQPCDVTLKISSGFDALNEWLHACK
jgi:hypothetical protein